MNEKEKLLLLQLILEDIRGNWADELKTRTSTALGLAQELDLQKHVDSIVYFREEIMDSNYCDGRYFRKGYKDGGYEGMSSLHGLEPTIGDKSEEFQRIAYDVLTYPEYRFEDWETYQPE